MNIVGVDPSLTGMGVAREDGTAVFVPPQSVFAKGYAARMIWQRAALLSEIALADLVVIEGIAFMAKGQRRAEIAGLGWVVRVAMYEAGIRWIDVPPSSLKSYAVANGNAKKQLMLSAAIQRLGYTGASYDEADALWLRQMALDHYGLPCARMPARNREALKGVEWPVLEVAGAVKHYGEDELPL